MAYRIDPTKCLKCGLCVSQCPEKAISGQVIEVSDGFTFISTTIDPEKCTDCGVCVSQEYWCPAQAISRV